jgi:hypothetical protein
MRHASAGVASTNLGADERVCNDEVVIPPKLGLPVGWHVQHYVLRNVLWSRNLAIVFHDWRVLVRPPSHRRCCFRQRICRFLGVNARHPERYRAFLRWLRSRCRHSALPGNNPALLHTDEAPRVIEVRAPEAELGLKRLARIDVVPRLQMVQAPVAHVAPDRLALLAAEPEVVARLSLGLRPLKSRKPAFML